MRLTRVLVAALAFAWVSAAYSQTAQPYPNQPIRIVVPYGPGGATDIVARILGERMTTLLGQPVVVENKAGGNGVVAIQDVVRSKPDGYTLLIGNVTTNTLNPIIVGKEMPVDPFKELVPITKLIEVPAIFLATKVNFPPSTIQEVVAYAKANPGAVNFNSAGYLAYSHLDFIQLQKRTGIEMTLIPLKAGAGGGQIDLINGEVHVAIQNAATVLPLVQSGKLKALAVTGDKRLAGLPDVPTTKEAGFEGWGTNAWQALFAPAGTPQPIVDKIFATVKEIMISDDAKKKFADVTMTITLSDSPAGAAKWLQSERVAWEPVVTEAKQLAKP
ncbi:tripartite tricarboxylate transporter substrate binding protein [Bosea sp. 117]|uniref:Bug family tripartite tricarboxylate transporter substrate binding protein n=1 Tax=Bosea sp. 117 TaxID=1125973 RepID=UPI0004943D73|nr:tripartite tricarboxylate transporter substrate binding protein [Bosea sp. 117]